MPTLAQIYEEHAKECLRSAARVDDPKRRDLLLKLASAWREDVEALKRGELLHPWRKAKPFGHVAEGAPRDAPAPAPLRRNKG